METARHVSQQLPPKAERVAPWKHTAILEHCHAYLIGSGLVQTRLLQSIASKLGFASATNVMDGGAVASTEAKVSFFLVHFLLHADVKRATLAAIRHSANDAVRFAPVILIADDCDYESVLEHVRLGYDDVISLPEKRPILAHRLETQISTDHLYIQTNDYLGPDRRRMDQPGHYRDRRGEKDHYHERLTIHRSIDAGIEVVERQVIL